ncbi:Rne/Rng family ribonuclease [Salisediminibacterium halotolerans]|uniref:Rne/Rng family ribonuclease n=1 Tax=Salisediminibacterium halotolerans TaxID=517425 RepID=UPI000EB2055D|nr:Rne/Rng family ribonuclease [Salisediminibacterium halotolerans]RLJ78216.1 RNAse G [Actinophytocola xinjiangensis]RPE88445.1 RNAse G [Salisediminibacterium halotolerans]TWG37193.1 RNAse G [Salisediminibacterium halotolerans]GEL07127.1 ribonuclease G [Salisediminibacterium halotolerans]
MYQVLINRSIEDVRGAVLENGRAAEFLLEPLREKAAAGSVIQAKVRDILPGMDAAFVDIGTGKNGFLYKKELAAYHWAAMSESAAKKKEKPIHAYLSKGQEIIVQVKKEADETKGAKLTELLSLPGQYCVFLPNGDYIAVSKKMSAESVREHWRSCAREWLQNREGVIIRTEAESVSADLIVQEIRALRAAYERILAQGRRHSGEIRLLFSESSVVARVRRDFLPKANTEIICNHLNDFKELTGHENPEHGANVRLSSDDNLFSTYALEPEMAEVMNPNVPLPSGGFLKIELTEALTVVDVNSGKYTGSRGLKETSVKTNIEAAETAARMLRLRDYSGLIVIDFIDMDEEAEAQVLAVMKEAVQADRTLTNVVGFTGLGLLEMTRKKVRDSLPERVSAACTCCGGTGRIEDAEEIALRLERTVLAMKKMADEALWIEASPSVYALFAQADKARWHRLEEHSGKYLQITVAENEPAFQIRKTGSKIDAEPGHYSN